MSLLRICSLAVACFYSAEALRVSAKVRRAFSLGTSSQVNTCRADPAGSSFNKCAEAMKPCVYGCENCESICYPCANLYEDFKCATEGAQPGQVSYESCRNIAYACSSYWGASCEGGEAAINCQGWKGTCIQYSDNVTAGCTPPKNATKGHITTARHDPGEPKAIIYGLQAISGIVNLLFLKQLLSENWRKWKENGQGQEGGEGDGHVDPEGVQEGGLGPEEGEGGPGHEGGEGTESDPEGDDEGTDDGPEGGEGGDGFLEGAEGIGEGAVGI